MVEVLNATLSRGAIEKIFTNAKEYLTVISPFIKINDELLSRLKDAGTRVGITLVCREKDLKDGEREKIESIPNLKLWFNDSVHTKCFYNEKSMVITSLNLYDSTTGSNHEMGVLLSEDVPSDQRALKDARDEAAYILRQSNGGKQSSFNYNHKQPLPKKQKQEEPSLLREIADVFGFTKQQGHCIRCGEIIPLDKESPYCLKCYKVWSRSRNSDYSEKICHKCGKPSKTSKKSPLCLSCFRDTRA
ncbi:MAG: phospholipase D family protein [Dehalogenimonas sp.]